MRGMCGADAGCLAINYQSLWFYQSIEFAQGRYQTGSKKLFDDRFETAFNTGFEADHGPGYGTG